jgi:hypothetical protein
MCLDGLGRLNLIFSRDIEVFTVHEADEYSAVTRFLGDHAYMPDWRLDHGYLS